MTDRYRIGERPGFDFSPASVVVGIDRYTLFSLAGPTKTWVSYTLESGEESGAYSRWWLSDEASGLYCWTAATSFEARGEFVPAESGLCRLVVEGDSTIGIPCSSVVFFRDGDTMHCAEIFEGSSEAFYMTGRKI